jgi:hypothetical protein
MIRREIGYEEIELGAITARTGEIIFRNMEGHTEILHLNGADPEDETAILAERQVTDPATNEFRQQSGRIIGRIMEGSQFVWQHKKEGAEGIVVAATIGVALHSLRKRYQTRKSK